MKSLKKVLVGSLATVMVLSCVAVPASAAKLTAYLGTGDTVKYSGMVDSIGGGELWGANDIISAGPVYVIAKQQYMGAWIQDCSVLLEKGAQGFEYPRRFATLHTWQLGINPKGANKYGCVTSGTLDVE